MWLHRFAQTSAVVASTLACLIDMTGCSGDSEDNTSPTPEVSLEVHRFLSGSDGFDTATYWVDTGEEVVVFDAQFTLELAQQMLDEINAATDSPVKYVVVTHPNPDKFNGATVFQAAGAKLVASSATAAAMPDVQAYKEAYFVGAGVFEAGEYPPLPTVDITFDTTLDLDLAGEGSVHLRVLENPGVTLTQTIAVVGSSVIVGDLAATGVHAWLEGAIVDGAPVPDIDGWIDALDELEATVGAELTLYPGRGEPAPVGEQVAAQKVYLADMHALVRAYVGTLTDPVAELSGENAGTHYANITAQAEAAYPGYGLSYLIQYGVYGLAFQEAYAGE